jgi:hypothetical protein
MVRSREQDVIECRRVDDGAVLVVRTSTQDGRLCASWSWKPTHRDEMVALVSERPGELSAQDVQRELGGNSKRNRDLLADLLREQVFVKAPGQHAEGSRPVGRDVLWPQGNLDRLRAHKPPEAS